MPRFYKKKNLSSMHKLHQISLQLDPAGNLLKTCCNSTGGIQTVCMKIDPSGEEIMYLVHRSSCKIQPFRYFHIFASEYIFFEIYIIFNKYFPCILLLFM